MMNNDKILQKIRNLLELAEDGQNDDESQTALLMAQKLMLKHKISQNDITSDEQPEIVLKSLSVYKRVYWWEKSLANVISQNFRVMNYMQSTRLPFQQSTARKIVLMGFAEDVELAYELYHLAAASMKYHASIHVKNNQQNMDLIAVNLRKAYYLGFIDGLKEKFAAQREEMSSKNDAYALAIQIPNEVQEAFQEQVGWGKISYREPQYTNEDAAYSEGFKCGKTINLTMGLLE